MMAPRTQFILLTQATSHQELAILDRPICATTGRGFGPTRPDGPRAILAAFCSKLGGLLRRGWSRRLLHDLGVDLLFCPFPAPNYIEFGMPFVCTIHDLQHKTYPFSF